jgi:hypothetical protein
LTRTRPGGSPTGRQTAGAGGCRVPPASEAGRPLFALDLCWRLIGTAAA